MDEIKFRLKSLFMSKSQIIYLISIFVSCALWGSFGGAFAFYDIGLGTKYYSFSIFINCLITCLYCWFSTDMKKKKWIFIHYRQIDLIETIFFNLSETTFLLIYVFGKYDPYSDITRVCFLFFYQGIFYKIVRTFLSVILPGIGDVYEQSLYKNQIDYQNHSRAENIMSCFGAAAGALISWLVGDFFKYRPWLTFLCTYADWYFMWSRWQFYFNKENYSIIKRNFAKDCGDWRRERNKKKIVDRQTEEK